MIKYNLKCNKCKNCFDSWFASSKEYEKLRKKKFLTCHFCNSLNVEKNLMFPNVFLSKSNKTIGTKSKKYKEIEKKMLDYQKFIKKNFNYVGENFAYEARSIHYNKKKTSKGIYGTATKEEFKELKEEGIEAETLPWVKDTSN